MEQRQKIRDRQDFYPVKAVFDRNNHKIILLHIFDRLRAKICKSYVDILIIPDDLG